MYDDCEDIITYSITYHLNLDYPISTLFNEYNLIIV